MRLANRTSLLESASDGAWQTYREINVKRLLTKSVPTKQLFMLVLHKALPNISCNKHAASECDEPMDDGTDSKQLPHGFPNRFAGQ